MDILNSLLFILFSFQLVSGQDRDKTLADLTESYCHPGSGEKTATAFSSYIRTLEQCLKMNKKDFEECKKFKFVGSTPKEISNSANCKKNAKNFADSVECLLKNAGQSWKACNIGASIVLVMELGKAIKAVEV